MKLFKKAKIARPKLEPIVKFIILVISIILLYFIINPIIQVLGKSITDYSGKYIGFVNYLRFLKSSYFRGVFYNTMLIAVTATFGAVILGTIFAFAITKSNIPGKNFFMFIGILPMITPAFINAFSLILLFGRKGIINNILYSLFNFRLVIYGWHGVVFSQIITLFPLAYIVTAAAFTGLGSELENAAMDLGANPLRIIRTITFPLITPAIMAASLLIFMTNLAAFGAPAILGGGETTLAVEAVIQVLGVGNWQMGTTVAVILLIPSSLVFFLQNKFKKKASYVTVTGNAAHGKAAKLPKKIRYFLFVLCTLVSIVVLSIYLTILLGSFSQTWGVDNSLTLSHYQTVIERSLESITNSTILAFIGGLGAAMLGLLISYIVVRQKFFGNKLMDSISTLPYAVPGTMMGLGFVIAFNKPPLILTGTALIIVFDYIIRRMPFALRTASSNLQQLDISMEESSADMGARWYTTFRRIVLPLLKPAFFSGFLFAFIRAITELTSTIFLVSPDHRLMSVDIYNFINYGQLGEAAAMSIILMIIVVVVVVLLYKITKMDLLNIKL
jgi:iron(III) transport system permease protein